MNTESQESSTVPKWLKHLQENSWEAEILISGGAIFSLFQLVDWVSSFVTRLKDFSLIEGTNEVFIFVHLTINGLIIGFASHLALRSLWIALVCLRYAYPEGINFQRLAHHPMFLQTAKSRDLTGQILKLDHLSGLIFFASISFALIIGGVILTSIVGFVLSPIGNVFTWIYFIGVLVFIIDFITLGSILRRWRFIALIYRPIYLFFNFTSLAFIFRPWFQVLFTNANRWKLYFAWLLFVSVSIGLTVLSVTGPLHRRSILDSRKYGYFNERSELWSENFYENLNQGTRVSFASIQDDIIKDDYLRVFIPYNVRHDAMIKMAGAKDFQGIVSIKLDDILLKPEWMVGDRLVSNQNGITAYIEIAKINHGKHKLTVEIMNATWPFPLTIPFWKQ